MDLAVNSRVDLGRRPATERIASFGLAPVTDIATQQQVLLERRSGCILVNRGHLSAVFGRWWPYLGNQLRTAWDQRFRRAGEDRCELFYHSPWSAPQFLTLSYISSSEQTSLSSIYAATLVLDEIARIKGSLAIVCHVTNDKISDRLMTRWGWEAHCREWSGRHFIKRFYGNYPEISLLWRARLKM